jgi:hypothetical protein
MDPTKKVRSNQRCLLTELEDGTGVLLHLDTKFYFTLNDTGVFVWKQLAHDASSGYELAEQLSERFEVTEEQAGRDVLSLLAELEANQLIHVA